MSRISAGLLMYRIQHGSIEILLAHPGGPFFRNKDEGAWSIPKGEVEPDEDLLTAAQREFAEELSGRWTSMATAGTSIAARAAKLTSIEVAVT